MAEREDLEFTYSLIDRVFRLSLGELADFSGAKYDGDFSLSLEQAQRRKHEYVAEAIGMSLPGSATPPAPDSRRDAFAVASGTGTAIAAALAALLRGPI